MNKMFLKKLCIFGNSEIDHNVRIKSKKQHPSFAKKTLFLNVKKNFLFTKLNTHTTKYTVMLNNHLCVKLKSCSFNACVFK